MFKGLLSVNDGVGIRVFDSGGFGGIYEGGEDVVRGSF